MIKKKLLFLILCGSFLLAGCGNPSENNNSSENAIADSISENAEAEEIVYEDIKIQDIIIPQSAKTEMISWDDRSVVFAVDRKFVIHLQAMENDFSYDEETVKEYLQLISDLASADENPSAIDVQISDYTSSIFTVYTLSLDSDSEFYGYGEYNGYKYVADLYGICESDNWEIIQYSWQDDVDITPYYEEFKNVLDGVRPQ